MSISAAVNLNNQLSVIIPVWNDDDALDGLLGQLEEFDFEVWVVDGAASPVTASLVADRARYIPAQPSRGAQIARGIAAASAQWLWILHAETRLNSAAVDFLRAQIAREEPSWGRFAVSLDGLRVIAWMMNLRSRLTRICTGDQAMFVHRSLLECIGGFPEQPLMEDIEVSKRLKAVAPDSFQAPEIVVTASARRWRRHGVARTVVSMWWYRWRYFRGETAQSLYHRYYKLGEGLGAGGGENRGGK